jgi:hypothetical protein
MSYSTDHAPLHAAAPLDDATHFAGPKSTQPGSPLLQSHSVSERPERTRRQPWRLKEVRPCWSGCGCMVTVGSSYTHVKMDFFSAIDFEMDLKY